MATFGKATFNAVNYAAARPTYPRELFSHIFRYHEQGVLDKVTLRKDIRPAGWDTAVDLGCGTGQATAELTRFRHVIGTDPSEKMLPQAEQYVKQLQLSSRSSSNAEAEAGSSPATEFSFQLAQAENLKFLGDASVDLVLAAQAAHWFDWNRLWPELARVVKPGGTVAFWGYSQIYLRDFPSPDIISLIVNFWQGKDHKTSLGPYWEQPGRSILNNYLQDIPDPSKSLKLHPDYESQHETTFRNVQREYFTGDHFPPQVSRPIILKKTMTWADLEAYIRSASSVHAFQDANPEDKSNPKGDLVTRHLEEVKAGIVDFYSTLSADHSDYKRDVPESVEVEWPLTLVLAKRAGL